MLTIEKIRAQVNRKLVANQVAAEGYDDFCHDKTKEQGWLPRGTCSPLITRKISKATKRMLTDP